MVVFRKSTSTLAKRTRKGLCKRKQHCWMLHVRCCAKFETGQTFQPTTPNISFVPWSPKRSTTMLDPFAQLFQHCWGHARSLRMDYKDLWVVFFPRCTAGPNIVGSCCIRLHATANTHATTPNIVRAPMLGVVAPVCTQLKSKRGARDSLTSLTLPLVGGGGGCRDGWHFRLSARLFSFSPRPSPCASGQEIPTVFISIRALNDLKRN